MVIRRARRAAVAAGAAAQRAKRLRKKGRKARRSHPGPDHALAPDLAPDQGLRIAPGNQAQRAVSSLKAMRRKVIPKEALALVPIRLLNLSHDPDLNQNLSLVPQHLPKSAPGPHLPLVRNPAPHPVLAPVLGPSPKVGLFVMMSPNPSVFSCSPFTFPTPCRAGPVCLLINSCRKPGTHVQYVFYAQASPFHLTFTLHYFIRAVCYGSVCKITECIQFYKFKYGVWCQPFLNNT